MTAEDKLGDAAAMGTDEAGEILWALPRAEWPRTQIGRYLAWLERERGLRFDAYEDLWQWSVDDLSGFWGSIWDHFGLISHADPGDPLVDRRMPGARWFPGAAMNYAEHCLRGSDDEVVIVARSQTRDPVEMTRGELRDAVARARAGLERLGVGRGDHVAAYLPNIPEAVVALLATASLGATWAVCAPEFGTQSVLDRLRQVEPKILISVDGYRYGRKDIDRREAAEAIRAGLPTVEATVHVPYLFDEVPEGPGSLSWQTLTTQPAKAGYEPVSFDHPLWVLFSSGTTGLPKAIVHGHGGIVLELIKSHALQSDLGPGERHFIFTTTGWVLWPILVTALAVGASIVLMDGDPAYPDGEEIWRTIAQTHTTSLGIGATILMNGRSAGQQPGKNHDLASLRSVAVTGSPLPADGFRWVYEAVKPDVYLQSSSGGTDIASGFVGGSPILPVRAGEIAGRLLGIAVDALDPDGNPVVGELGELVVSAPMPSMPLYFLNDPNDERYQATYFDVYPGLWRHGDWIRFNQHGGCVITGRSDATLNRGGVRLGTSEFYTVLDEFPEIDDSLVIHLEDQQGGLGRLLLFLVLTPGAELDDGLRKRIAGDLRRRLSPRHVPDEVYVVSAIPYNLTGKKLEVPVKRILQGVKRADVASDGALRDPAALDIFQELALQIAGEAT